jgi:hypothetical protein
VTQTMQRSELTWGDALVLKVHRARVGGTRVGLSPFVDAIRAAVGKHIGTRPTFAKLYDVTDVESMSEIERFRAWLLLTAIGEDPDDWGIRADVVPPAIDAERLRGDLDLCAVLPDGSALLLEVKHRAPSLCAIRDSNPEPADSWPAAGRPHGPRSQTVPSRYPASLAA